MFVSTKFQGGCRATPVLVYRQRGVKWCSHFGEQLGLTHKAKTRHTVPMLRCSLFHFQAVRLREMAKRVHWTHTRTSVTDFFLSQTLETTQRPMESRRGKCWCTHSTPRSYEKAGEDIDTHSDRDESQTWRWVKEAGGQSKGCSVPFPSSSMAKRSYCHRSQTAVTLARWVGMMLMEGRGCEGTFWFTGHALSWLGWWLWTYVTCVHV